MRNLSQPEILLQSLGITEPSEIDLAAIAWDQGAEVRYRKLNDCEARILGVGNRAIISVDESIYPRRQRFSVGHELGHWHHHRGRSFSCRKKDIGNYAEISDTNHAENVANQYAANLLLPVYIFKDVADQFSQPTFDTIFSIADEFDVSKTCTAIRYVEHANIPCILICYNKNGRRWFKRNKDIPDRLFPNKEIDHETLAFESVFGSLSKTPRSVSCGDSWFNWRDADRYEVWEESVKISTEETLTLLTWKNEKMLAVAAED